MVWPWLMGFAACLTLGGLLVRDGQALRIGVAMFTAYVMMRGVYTSFEVTFHAPLSLTIWAGASGYVARLFGNYGKSLIPLKVSAMLLLSGACYLWGYVAGVRDRALQIRGS